MSLFRRRPRPPKGGVADRLREANERLYGWTVRGDGIPLGRLIDEAAEEIDRLEDALAASLPDPRQERAAGAER